MPGTKRSAGGECDTPEPRAAAGAGTAVSFASSLTFAAPAWSAAEPAAVAVRQETEATFLPVATGNSRNLYGGAGSLAGSDRSIWSSPMRNRTMLFKASAPAAPAGDMVIARLNVRAQPLDRGEVFEDPLEEILQASGTGRVTGGGTMLGEEGEIEFCDIEITLPAATDVAIGALRRALEGLGAPRGSTLIGTTGRTSSRSAPARGSRST